jgi:multisubunit Na+/H+ antiporter MnhB subunit
MKIIWILSNAGAVISALVCMSYLYYECRPVKRRRLPVFSMIVIGALVAFILPLVGMAFRSSNTGTFAARDTGDF